MKKISKKDVLKYRFKKKNMFLVNRQITLPTGKKIQKEVILHPGAVLIVPFLTRDKLIIIRQFRAAINKYHYEFPAGTLEPGEKLAACGRRELMEEGGYWPRKITRMGMIYPVPAYSDEKIYIFKAENLFPKKAKGDDDEVIEPIVISRTELKKLFKAGKIDDAKTIAGLAFCGIL